MNLTIIYRLTNIANSLDKSFQSLLNQTNKNFELIIIADNTSKSIQKYFVDIDLNDCFKSIKYIKTNQKLGAAYCFNLSLKYLKTPYVYFADARVVFNENFVDSFEKNIGKDNADIFVYNTLDETTLVKTIRKTDYNINVDKLYSILLGNLSNKIINTALFKDNKIEYASFHHYTLLDTLKLFEHVKKVKIIKNMIVKIFTNNNPNYNIYDVVDQNNFILSKNYANYYKKNTDDINYLIIRTILFTFLSRIAIQNKWECNHLFKNAYNYAIEWLKTYIPNWKDNKILNTSNNLDNKKIVGYLKKFPNRFNTTFYELKKLFDIK